MVNLSPRVAHEAHLVQHADDVALRAVPVRVVGGVTVLGIAALRAGAVYIGEDEFLGVRARLARFAAGSGRAVALADVKLRLADEFRRVFGG